MDPYEKLANAIILQAVRDWRHGARLLKRHLNSPEGKRIKYDTEKFFKSKWFSCLTNIDGEMLLQKLQEEVNES
ncbi:MAG: hypothetical protein SPL49_04560 [Oribacterium sp.]|nr:hypothetical protein [Oribacterium sp.]